MRGRKPTPTPLKLIRGNPGKRRLPDAEPVPPDGVIEAPDWLGVQGLRFWREWEPILRAMRVLTVADIEPLATMCETQAEFVEARADVRKNGMRLTVYDEKGESVVVNPAVKIASDANKRLRAMWVEFGLTPSSRSRIKAEKPKVEEEDKWAGLLS